MKNNHHYDGHGCLKLPGNPNFPRLSLLTCNTEEPSAVTKRRHDFPDAKLPSQRASSRPVNPLSQFSSIKDTIVTKISSCFIDKSLVTWFVYPCVFIVLSSCSIHPPLHNSFPSSILLFYSPSISVVFQHFKSEASRDYPMSAGVIQGISPRLLEVIILVSFIVK